MGGLLGPRLRETKTSIAAQCAQTYLLNVLLQLQHGALLVANAVVPHAVGTAHDKRARQKERRVLERQAEAKV